MLLGFLGPLIVMLTKGNESPYVRRQAVSALNFQLTWLIYAVVSLFLTLILIGFLMLLVGVVVVLIVTITAAVKASNAEEYRYPFSLSMVS